MTTETRLSCAETATHLRKALAAAFPGVKFSVRSKVYSMGASITVYWTDGPASSKVQPICDKFSGASFDGMIDLKSYHDSDLTLPDGTVQRVSFGADYVFTSRTVSDYSGQYDRALGLLRQSLGGIEKVTSPSGGEYERWGDRWLTDLASGMVNGRDGSESLEQAMKRIILREG